MNVIVYEDSCFLIADKSHGMPTVPLKSQSLGGTLLGLVAEQCPDVLSVKGKNSWEYGTLHRLDTSTSGLVVFAKDQNFYDYLWDVQFADKFEKTYLAYCDESDRIPNGKISSYFRSFGPGAKLVRSESRADKADSDRLYTTIVKRVGKGVYECKITRGFRHQIRVHLSSNGCPIIGDNLYNQEHPDGTLMLTCISVSFPMPDGRIFTYNLQ